MIWSPSHNDWIDPELRRNRRQLDLEANAFVFRLSRLSPNRTCLLAERAAANRTCAQHWMTFVRNHTNAMVACDCAVAATLHFQACLRATSGFSGCQFKRIGSSGQGRCTCSFLGLRDSLWLCRRAIIWICPGPRGNHERRQRLDGNQLVFAWNSPHSALFPGRGCLVRTQFPHSYTGIPGADWSPAQTVNYIRPAL